MPRALVRLTWNFLQQDCLYDDALGSGRLTESSNLLSDDGDDDGLDGSSAPPFDQAGASILVTTFAQLRTLHSRHQHIPSDWIVWFDDSDINDVIDIAPFDPRRHARWTEEDAAKRTFEINGRRYHGRPATESLGKPYSKHLCVFTTTERVTLTVIERLVRKHGHRARAHDRMTEIIGGKITILGTEKVYAKQDGVIPLRVRQLNKKKHAVRLIADGLSQGLTHSSSKGKNDLADKNLVVEVSRPHPGHVMTLCDALGLSFETEGRNITRDLMLDQMHQAIGCNSGYRFKGGESVVLVDRNHHEWLAKDSRYLIDAANNVLIDRRVTMSRRDRRTTGTASKLVRDIESFLNNLDEYFSDARKVGPDISAVMNDIRDGEKRVAYAKRLIQAIYPLPGVTLRTAKAIPTTGAMQRVSRIEAPLVSCLPFVRAER